MLIIQVCLKARALILMNLNREVCVRFDVLTAALLKVGLGVKKS